MQSKKIMIIELFSGFLLIVIGFILWWLSKQMLWILIYPPPLIKQLFEILSDNKIITEELSKKFKLAKGMRNVIVHKYGIVNDRLVFEAVKYKIIPDTEEFIKSIKDFLNLK